MKNFLLREFENSCDPEQWEEKNMASSFDVLEMNFKISENIAKPKAVKAQHRFVARPMKLSTMYEPNQEYAFVVY